MSRELIVKEVTNIEEAIGRIQEQCFLRHDNPIEHLEDNKVKVYTRNYVFILKLKAKAEWKVLKK